MKTPSPALPSKGRESKPQAVLFDYGHTLIHFDEKPHRLLLEAYEKINALLAKHLEREVPEAQVLIEKVSKAVDAEIVRHYESDREEEVEIAALYDSALRAIGLEVAPELIERVMETEQHGWLRAVHVEADVKPTLAELRERGLRLGVVSNAAYRPRLMLEQMTALGLSDFFDAITFSSEIGWRKPSRRIYEQALDKLGVEASRALFVGDRMREDVLGPKSLGMRGILMRQWRQDETSEGADFVIERLGDLRAIVARLLADRSTADTYN